MRGVINLKVKIYYPTIIYSFFVFIFMLVHVVSIPAVFANLGIAISGLVALMYSFLKRVVPNKIVLAGICFSLLLLFSHFVNGNVDLQEILWIWSYMGVAVILYSFYISSKTLMGIACAVDLFFLYCIFSGIGTSDVIKMGSQNNISVYVLVFTLIAYLKLGEERKRLTYLPALLAIAISGWTASRAGVFASLALIVLLFFYNSVIISGKKFKEFLKALLLIGISIYVATNIFSEYLQLFFEKMDRYGTASLRTMIWSEYFYGITHSLLGFLFGINTRSSEYHWLSYYQGNTHNAYLMLHSKFGIIGFLSVLFIHIKTVFKGLSSKNYTIVIVLAVFTIRSFFDWTGFPGVFDIVIWYCALFCFSETYDI